MWDYTNIGILVKDLSVEPVHGALLSNAFGIYSNVKMGHENFLSGIKRSGTLHEDGKMD